MSALANRSTWPNPVSYAIHPDVDGTVVGVAQAAVCNHSRKIVRFEGVSWYAHDLSIKKTIASLQACPSIIHAQKPIINVCKRWQNVHAWSVMRRWESHFIRYKHIHVRVVCLKCNLRGWNTNLVYRPSDKPFGSNVRWWCSNFQISAAFLRPSL